MTPYLLYLKDGVAHTMGELTEFCATYMIDLNLGVSARQTYEIKKLDIDFFNE